MGTEASPSSPVIEVHQSEVSEFDLCGERYRRRVLDREPDEPGTAALRGGGVHGAAEVNHLQKRRTGKDLPLQEMVDAGVAAFEEKKVREGFRLTPEEMKVGVKPTIARTVHAVTKLTGLYARDLAPLIEPVLVEEKVEASIPGTNVKLAGRIDVTTKLNRVHDLKTSTKRKTQADADGSIQFTMYDILYEKRMGQKAGGFEMDALLDQKKLEVQRLVTRRGPRDRQVLINRINTMLRARAAGIFAPAPVGSWICTPKWCGYWNTCPYVNSERMAASQGYEE